MDARHKAAVIANPSTPTFAFNKRLNRLFLSVGSLLSLGLGALLAGAGETGLAADVAELAVGSLLTGVVGELALDNLGLVLDGEGGGGLLNEVLLGRLDLLSRGVTLLGGLAVAGEQDDAAAVGLQALDVGGKRLLGEVLAAGVDRDTDGGCKLAGDASSLGTWSVTVRCKSIGQQDTHLQLSKGETTASADAAVVLESGAADDRAELVDGAGSDGSGLSSASVAASLLLAGLGLGSCQEHVADHRRLHSQEERGITWSKCTRTRRCQSLRKWLWGICWLCLMAWGCVSLAVSQISFLAGVMDRGRLVHVVLVRSMAMEMTRAITSCAHVGCNKQVLLVAERLPAQRSNSRY